MTPVDPRDEEIAGSLRGAEGEARPREKFRRRLREAFVEGSLSAPFEDREPDDDEPMPDPVVRQRHPPRGVLYPLAAAFAAGLLVVTGALGPRGVPEPLLPPAPRVSPAEAALAAAERRLHADPAFAGRPWQRRVVEGRPVLLPSERAFGDAAELADLCSAIARAEGTLARELPEAAARPARPTVILVLPSRAAFEGIVAPLIAPVPLEASTVAFAHPGLRLLLLSPGVLDPGGPPCEEMDIVHEAVHAWLQARRGTARPLPLWVEEGLAGIVSQAGVFETREWCRRLLASVRAGGVDPVGPAEVLDFRSYPEMARVVKGCAPCEERPFSMLPAFHSHAEALVLYLLDEAPDAAGRRAAFRAWLGRALDGAEADAAATAEALGFPGLGALFAARDAWLGL